MAKRNTAPMSIPSTRRLATFAAAAAGLAALAPAALGQATNRTIFVGHYYTQGSIASMNVNPDGTVSLAHLTPIGEWIQSVALSPNGQWLAAASGTSNDLLEGIYIFRVMSDASLSLVYAGTVPDSPLDMKWLDNDLLAVTETNITASHIGVFLWQPDIPELTRLTRQPSGGFNSAIAYHPGSEYFYTQISSGAGGPSINRWKITPDRTFERAGDFFPGPYPLAPVFTAAGDMLFAGGGISFGRHAVISYLVSEEEGGLIPAPGMPFESPGNSPAYLAPTGDGLILAVGHGSDSTVRTFFVEPNGVLTSTGHSFLVQNLTGSIGELAAINDIIYVTDDTSALDGVQGMHALRVGADGSLTPLAEIVYTGAPRPEGGIAVWNPTTVCPADFNGDSRVNSNDISAFLSRWLADVESGSRYADFDRDAAVNSNDISAFLSAWLAAVAQGCG